MKKSKDAVKRLFEVKDVDRRFFEERLQAFLPDELIDFHTHVYRSAFQAKNKSAPLRTVTWPARVAAQDPVEDLNETYSLLFPGKTVTPVMFSSLGDRADDFEAANAYVAESAMRYNYPCLLYARPDWSAETVAQKLASGPFKGLKVYLSLSDPSIPVADITIYDFLPPAQLALADRKRLIVMLHLPRNARLKDPVNVAQMMEIDEKFPNAKVVIAHVGRAYCASDIGDAWKTLSKTKNLLFDISANTNTYVFARLIEAVGPKRILFGSDLPITRMRMRRIEEHGRYVNLVPKGLYGDVSGDPNMREVTGDEAEQLTFFLYEELDAFRRAAASAGLSRTDMADVFCRNAELFIGAQPARNPRE